LKTQLTPQYFLLVFLTMVSTWIQVVFDSAVAHKEAMSPILNRSFSEVNELAAVTHTMIDRMTLSLEVKMVTNKPSKSRNQNSLERQMVLQAKKDLAQRLSVEADQINLLEVRQVTWPDSSLGCPQPGKVYNQEPQDGLLIRLEIGGRMYFYHSGGTLDPFFCEQTSEVVPHPTKGDEFVPPPGSEID